MCPSCGQRLRDSQYRNNGELKSCPHCSQREGVHIFYPLSGFGLRHDILQSWCSDCRAGKMPSAPAYRCK